MKLTKSKLLQLIKEETEAALAEENGGPSVEEDEGWVDKLEDWMLTLWTNRPGHLGDLVRTYGRERAEEEHQRQEARIERLKEKTVEFYNKLPDIGKEHLIKNLEMYAEKFASPWTEYLNALSAPLEESLHPSDREIQQSLYDILVDNGLEEQMAATLLSNVGMDTLKNLLRLFKSTENDDETY